MINFLQSIKTKSKQNFESLNIRYTSKKLDRLIGMKEETLDWQIKCLFGVADILNMWAYPFLTERILGLVLFAD